VKTTLSRARQGKVARDRYDITISFLRDVPMLPEPERQNRICTWCMRFTATDPPQRRTRMIHVSEGSKGGLACLQEPLPSAELNRAVRLVPVKDICSCRCDVIRGAHTRSRGGGHILLHACTHFPFVILWTSNIWGVRSTTYNYDSCDVL
jgi:hypothetical protein